MNILSLVLCFGFFIHGSFAANEPAKITFDQVRAQALSAKDIYDSEMAACSATKNADIQTKLTYKDQISADINAARARGDQKAEKNLLKDLQKVHDGLKLLQVTVDNCERFASLHEANTIQSILVSYYVSQVWETLHDLIVEGSIHVEVAPIYEDFTSTNGKTKGWVKSRRPKGSDVLPASMDDYSYDDHEGNSLYRGIEVWYRTSEKEVHFAAIIGSHFSGGVWFKESTKKLERVALTNDGEAELLSADGKESIQRTILNGGNIGGATSHDRVSAFGREPERMRFLERPGMVVFQFDAVSLK